MFLRGSKEILLHVLWASALQPLRAETAAWKRPLFSLLVSFNFLQRSSIWNQKFHKQPVTLIFHAYRCRRPLQLQCFSQQNINCKQIFGVIKKNIFSMQAELILALAEELNYSRNIWTLLQTFSFGRNVICVDPPPRSKIPTVLLLSFFRWPKKISYFNPAAATKRHPRFRAKILFNHGSYIKPGSIIQMNSGEDEKTQNIQLVQHSPVRKFMVIQARMPTFRGLAETDAQQGRANSHFRGSSQKSWHGIFTQNYTGRHRWTRVNTGGVIVKGRRATRLQTWRNYSLCGIKTPLKVKVVLWNTHCTGDSWLVNQENWYSHSNSSHRWG